MRNACLLPFALTFLAVLAADRPAEADTELDKASRAAHGDGEKKSEPAPSAKATRGSGKPVDPDETSDAIHTIVTVAAAPWSIPYEVIEEDDDVPSHEFSFRPYPYANGARGYFKRAQPVLVATTEDGTIVGAAVPHPERTKEVAGQLRLDGSHLLSNAVRTNALGRLLLPYRFELETDWSLFADFDSNRTSYAALGSAHLAIRFAETERVVFRSGLGTRHWIDARGAEHGGDLLYGVDVFWGKPMTTTLEGRIGWVGSAFVGEVRGTVGVMLGPVEVLLGYDHIGMHGGGLSASLGGPVLGLRAFL